MNKSSLSASALSLVTATVAISYSVRAQVGQAQNPPSIAGSELTVTPSIQFEAVNVFEMSGSASQPVREMQARLADPQQRAVVRAEQRETVLFSHQDLGEALDIDATTEQALIELLTDQQMDQLDEFHFRFAARSGSMRPESQNEYTHEHAANETKRVEALRALLGQDKLERFQTYKMSSGERVQIAQLNARLDAAHKLSAEQKERLIPIYMEHSARLVERDRRASFSRSPFGKPFEAPPSAKELQRLSQLQTIAANEEIWRRMPASDRALRQQAAAVLTPQQLATLEQLHAEKASNLQQWIENARVQAGLSPSIPDQSSQPSPPPRTLVAGDVRVSIKVTVDRNEPVSLTQVVRNGESVTFEASDQLLVKATPTLYDDRMFDLQLAYFERGNTGERLIGHTGQMGQISATPAAGLGHQGGSTVFVGSKGYAIEMSSVVEPM